MEYIGDLTVKMCLSNRTVISFKLLVEFCKIKIS